MGRRGVANACWVLAAAGGLATGLGFLGAQSWVLDLFAHFRVQYAVGLALVAAIAALVRAFRPALLAAVLALGNAALVAPAFWGAGTRIGPAPGVRLLVANVLTSNRDHGAVLRLVDRVDPDVVGLLETDEAWVAALAPLRARYPHVVSHPRPDNFGLLLLSRFPLAEPGIQYFGAELPSIVAGIVAHGRTITFALTHPVPPVSAAASAARDFHLEELAEAARAYGPDTVVCGDFNATPWSHPFRRFVSRSGLRDSRAGFGLQATWPTWFVLARIPIDHCLVGDGLIVRDRRVEADVGSDHLPIVLDVVLR